VDPLPLVVAMGAANIVLSSAAIAVGLLLEPSVQIGVPLLRSWLTIGLDAFRPMRPILLRLSALAVGLAAIVLGSGLAFRSQLPSLPDNFVFPPIWQGILMMLGAAVREEILFRFFALNLFVWLAMKTLRKQEPTTTMVWAMNVLAALVFTGKHLLPAGQLLDLNDTATGAAMALATVAGVVLGWVYWRHGLLMAMFTHAIAGLLVYLGARGLVAFAS
jgi:membrane protease YdiL (CAAX protease family)